VNDPLSGVGVLVTRPLVQAQSLARTLSGAGAIPVVFPGVEIEPVDPAQLTAALRAARNADFIVFVSPTAARTGMQLLAAAGATPLRARLLAIGPGTAKELRAQAAGEINTPPDGYDSEALARHPLLQSIKQSTVVIFRGRGGREYLATCLKERGAQVVIAECYHRVPPHADFSHAVAQLASGRIAAWTASSVEIVNNLFALAGADGSEWLRCRVVFVPHARIATSAYKHGARGIVVTGPGDGGLMSGLRTWFGRLRCTTGQQAT
jgi:uroporphyrinogen-III synthase